MSGVRRRRLVLAALTATLVSWPAGGGQNRIETPSLEVDVKAGKLPPIAERLPNSPAVVDLAAEGKVPGRHGGELRLLMGKQKDTRMMTVYGYARLVALTPQLKLESDILERFEVKDGREFTFYLRPGHKWSDGQPFTAEDFRYFWEDMINNEKLARKGLPKALLVGEEGPKFEIIDELTVRYSWSKPNPLFLPWLARPRPLRLYRPAHYLKQFHIRYGDKAKIESLIKKERKADWAKLHSSRDHYYRVDNPDRPTLQPWMDTTSPPSDRFVYVRNPYYHRIDKNGRQLPYIDRVVLSMGSTKMIPAKTGSGDSDLQARYLRFDHYTFLKESEKRYDFTVRLWQKARGAQIALFPNLNAADPGWRNLLQDVRFRRALSLAIDRHEINQVIYYGLAREGNNTILPGSPLFKPKYQHEWARFDMASANILLDEIGLTERTEDGVRKMSDGRPIVITVDTAGESTEQSDVLELIHDTWIKVGIKLFTKPAQREVFRQRISAGQTVMSVWSGISNGIPTAAMSPDELVPSRKDQFQWPKWGQYVQTSGRSGEEPTLPAALRLMQLGEAWPKTSDPAEQLRIWHEILQINTAQVFSIGIVNTTLQPVVINNRLRNVPEKGFYNWNPGAYFGVYKPDTFWYASN